MVVANPQTAWAVVDRDRVQVSQAQSELQLQQYVEQYINHRLEMIGAWNEPGSWAIYNFKIVGHKSVGGREYVAGTADWNRKKSVVYAVAVRDKEGVGWRGCGWSVSPMTDSSNPIHWAMMTYRHQIVVMGLVTDDSIARVRLQLVRPDMFTEAPVGKDGFFLKIIDTKQVHPRPKGLLIKGLDRQNRVVDAV